MQRLGVARELMLHRPSTSPARSRRFAEDVNHLQVEFDRVERMDAGTVQSCTSDENILLLIRGIRSLLREYEDDLRLVPFNPVMWNGNAADALTDRLRKLSQYVVACDELLRAARRYHAFAQIAVDFVALQQIGSQLSANADNAASGIIENSCTHETLAKISGHRGEKLDILRGRVKERLRKTTRLHAEVQLVMYYEHHPTRLQPRVICSSKSACYLCYLLLKLHGQFFIPSTHGKLYDSWKWPTEVISGARGARVGLSRLLPVFSDSIDQKIQESLGRGAVRRRAEPLESRVDLFAVITPSHVSWRSEPQSAHSHATCRTAKAISELDNAAEVETDADGTVSGTSTVTRASAIVEPVYLHQALSKQVEDALLSSTLRSKTQDANDSSIWPRQQGFEDSSSHQEKNDFIGVQEQLLGLREGESTTYSLQMNELLHVRVPGLHLSLEFDPRFTGNTDTGKMVVAQIPRVRPVSLKIEVEWLSCTEVDHATMMDLDGEWVEKSAPEGALLSADGLSLKSKSTILRLHGRLDEVPATSLP
jgi:OTT_1508-like deaminase